MSEIEYGEKVLIITTKRLFCIVLILVSCCRLFAADPNAWEQLNLSSAQLAGANVYYEKCFEPNLPFFEKAYKQFLTEQDKLRIVPSKQEQIIAGINEILGRTDPNTAIQKKILAEITDFLFPAKPTFYLVKRTTTKDFLRAGGQLPNFEYDKATDAAIYRLEFMQNSKNETVEEIEVSFPLGSEAEFEQEVSMIFNMLAKKCFGTGKIGISIHEVVEISIIDRVKPKGVYWRWFTDGFANAITFELFKKYAGAEMAEGFIAAYDVNKYKDLEREINLQYWMNAQCCILPLGGPIEYESRFTTARYAYATLEAQRLVEKHGISCVKKILDMLSQKDRSTIENLLATIKEVTGEDMQQRLGHYQTFETRKEGMDKYVGLLNAASDKKDYEQMLINLLRMLELQDSQLSPTGLRCYKEAALMLFKLGHEEAGDEAMHNCVELFKNSGTSLASNAAMETFIIYAFNTKNAKKAEKMAEELLKTRPNHLLALTAQMVVHAEAKRLIEAKQIAKRILSLDKNEQSMAYKTASHVLATDPNQQGPDK